MAKQATLTTITSTNNNAATLNANFNALNTALDNTLSRDGSTPNTMTADFDLNSNDLLNAASIRTGTLYIAGTLVNSIGNLANWQGAWATSTPYDAYDIVYESTNNALYRCLVDHTSGTFATDLAANNWEVYVDYDVTQVNVNITGGSITGITDLAVADGGTGASDAATARTNLGAQASNALLTDIAGLTLSTGDILYYDGTNITNLGAGSNGEVLTLASGVPSWASSGGALTRLAAYSGSGSEVDIALDQSGGRRYVIQGIINPATDGVNLLARTTTDNFTTVESSAGAYDWLDQRRDDSGATAVNQSNSDTSMRLATNLGNASNEFWSGEITVDHPHNSSFSTVLRTEAQRINSAGAMNVGYAGSRRAAAEDNDGVRLYASSGNITWDLVVYVVT